MTRGTLRRGTGADQGAYAVMYAVLTIALVGAASIVVDLGALRLDRRADRAAADAAAIAAAGHLGELGQNAGEACATALDYLASVLGAARPSDTCASLPPTCDPTTPNTASPDTLMAGREITITWPIPDGHPLMTEADVEGSAADDASAALEAVNTASDGDPCQRIGVEISHNRQFVFGGVFGRAGATTTSHSVGLALERSGGGVAVPLVALAEDSCPPEEPSLRLLAGDVEVGEPPGPPGEVAIDANGSTCSVIAIESGSLHADRIGIFMLDPVGYPAGIGDLISRSWRVTERPWRDRYNCPQVNPILCGLPETASSPANYTDQWRDYGRGIPFAPPAVPAFPRPPDASDPDWTVLSGSSCVAEPSYATNVYADCNELTIGAATLSGALVATGNVTVNGAVTIGAPLSVGGDLTVSAQATINGDAVVHGYTTFAGKSGIQGDLYVAKDLTVSASVDVSGVATAARNLTVDNLGELRSARLFVGRDFTVNGSAGPLGATQVGRDLNIRGGATAELNAALVVHDDLDVSGNAALSVRGALIVQNSQSNRTDPSRGIRVRDSACLLVSTATAVTCGGSLPKTSADGPGVFVNGRLSVSDAASFVGHKSFVHLTGLLTATTTGRVHLSAPAGSALCEAGNLATPPTSSCFEDLAVWAAGDGPHVLTLSGTDEIEGTLFAPNGNFEVHWSGSVQLSHAQLVAQRLIFDGSDVSGSTNELTIRPDPERSTLIPRSAGVLIR